MGSARRTGNDGQCATYVARLAHEELRDSCGAGLFVKEFLRCRFIFYILKKMLDKCGNIF